MTFKVKKDSWHFKWILWYNYLKDYNSDFYPNNSVGETPRSHYEKWVHAPRDFCSYWRNVFLWPSLRISINLILYAFILFELYLFGFVGAGGASIVLGFIAAGVALIALVITIKDFMKRSKKEKTRKMADDGIFKTIHSSYKNNLCPLVEYEKDDK